MCAILADTSSAAAGITATVRASAAMCAALTLEATVAKSVAAASISSGAAITNDTSVLPHGHHQLIRANASKRTGTRIENSASS